MSVDMLHAVLVYGAGDQAAHCDDRYRKIAAERMPGCSAKRPFNYRSFFERNIPLPQNFKDLFKVVRDELLGRTGNVAVTWQRKHSL